MILSSECEENAKKLCKLDELNNLDVVYAADSFRTIGTAKYIHDHDTEVSCWKPIETGGYKSDKNNQ